MLIRRRTAIKQDLEKSFLMMMITNTEFLSEIIQIIEPDLFNLDVGKIISRWIIKYYQDFNKAPGRDIQAIFIAKKEDLTAADSTLIAEFLQQLSDDYINNPPDYKYYSSLAVDFFKKQKMKYLAVKAQGILDSGGELRSAEATWREYQAFTVNKSEWVNPLAPISVNKVFDELMDPVLELPPEMAKVFGHFHRGWLVSVMGPPKRGKTGSLLELAIMATTQKRRTIFISLEMTVAQIQQRMYQNLGSFGEPTKTKPEDEYEIPALDCKRNQDNTCTLSKRTCRVGVPEGLYKPGQEYTPCSMCQRSDTYQFFLPTVYLTTEIRPTLNYKRAVESVKDFSLLHGNFLRIRAYPAYSASLTDILSDISQLEATENFQPDVIILDYPDILRPDDERKEVIHQTDMIWKKLKSISQELNCLVIVATQAKRETFKKRVITAMDTPWDIRKAAHVDLKIGINANETDKRLHITHYNVVVHRWKDFTQNKVYTALQQLGLGQVNLSGFVQFLSDKD